MYDEKKNSFFALFLNHFHGTRDVKLFLEDLLTQTELDALVERWEIIKRLAKGQSQREISKELGVGIATVSRGAKALEEGSGGFMTMLKRTHIIK